MKKIFIIFSLLVGLLPMKGTAQATILNENFSTCNPNLPVGWLTYSVFGVDSWNCTASGVVGNGAYMNGYSGGGNNNNEDWLISPELNLANYVTPHVSFWSRTKFAGSALQVLISYNYSGIGNPNFATWTTLSVSLPAPNSDYWFLSQNIDLSPYKSQPFYVAFKYTSNVNAAALWRIDEVKVEESALSLQKKFLNVGQCVAGSASTSSTFEFTMSGISGNLEVIAPTPFQLSKDNINFGPQLTYNAAASGIPQTVYARIQPNVPDKVYRDSIQFVYNGFPVKERAYILGTSLPDDRTLRVVNWNMRWFGEPNFCNCDTALARSNATLVLKDLNADLYCIQELVNVNALALLTTALGPNYQSVVSPYCSGATNPGAGNYPSGQKLAYIYNSNKIQNLGTFGILASTYPNDTMPYYCFSSGRFPFVLKAKLLLANGGSDTIIFANIHGKASTTQSDYDRRVCASERLTDSLNSLFPQQKVMVVGDYNDFLEGSTVTGNVNSPYKYVLDHGFTGISLPSKYPGQSTYTGSTDYLIDNIVSKSNLYSKYVDSSFLIFNEAIKYINDYSNTTSDHFPCMTYHKFVFPTSTTTYQQNHSPFHFQLQNPSSNTLSLFDMDGFSGKASLRIFDLFGSMVFSKELQVSTKNCTLQVPDLSSGMYFVELSNQSGRNVQKWIVEQ
nr:choice-of-anchor J domain-containing protein [Chitinophagaceae bacterium]